MRNIALVPLLLATLSSAQLAWAGPPPSRASRAEYDKAQTTFEAAKKLYEKGKIEDALAGFRRSYEVVASPISHLFVARCLAVTGHEAEAYAEMTDVIAEADAEATKDKRYVETRQAAEQERSDLAAKIGLVTVKIGGAPPDATLRVGGKTIPRARWSEPIAVAPGADTEIALEAAGGLSDRKTVKLAAGERKDLPMSIGEPSTAPAPEPVHVDDGASSRKTMRTMAYVAGGVGVAGIATFAIAGSLARSKYDELHAACGGTCPASKQSDVDAGRRTTTIANVGLVVGAVGAAAGVTLFVLSREPKHEPAATVSGGPGWIGVSGRF